MVWAWSIHNQNTQLMIYNNLILLRRTSMKFSNTVRKASNKVSHEGYWTVNEAKLMVCLILQNRGLIHVDPTEIWILRRRN